MTPKEKAEELVMNFAMCNIDANGNMTDTNGKGCALIAVDEIIKELESIYNLPFNYWNEVKQEIEKL